MHVFIACLVINWRGASLVYYRKQNTEQDAKNVWQNRHSVRDSIMLLDDAMDSARLWDDAVGEHHYY